MLVTVMFCQAASAEWADWILNASLDGGFEDNTNFGIEKYMRLSDVTTSQSVLVGRYYQLGDYFRLSIAADLKAKEYKRYDGLDNVYSGATVALTHKCGWGLEAPWLRIHSSAGYLSFNEAMRDSWMYNGGLTFGKRFSERFDMLLSYNFIYRNGKNSQGVAGFMGNPFDQVGNKGSVVLSYLLTEQLLASLGDSVYYGDVTSTVEPGDFNTFKSFTKALIRDTTFNRRLGTYRFEALANEFTAGLSYALSGHTSLNVNYTRVDGYASDLHYYDNLVSTSIKYSF
ncbi:MAG: hypothetical protein HQL03_10595 [Nitrospirae bacterium]|nr:hypothetical protein [Nitrospirota bacterium]MBF0591902.1 hypothetical protein [Nitrospirota bacterium]